MKKLLFLALFSPSIMFAQDYSFQELNLTIEGQATDEDISNDTYIDVTIDGTYLTWDIIEMDIPTEWFTTFCFEQCYPPGINTGDATFNSGTSNLVNCHVYPENTVGDGVVKMSVTDGTRTDTVTWNVSTTSGVGLEEMLANQSLEIEALFDLQGRRIQSTANQQIVIIRYKNGDTKKVYVIED